MRGERLKVRGKKIEREKKKKIQKKINPNSQWKMSPIVIVFQLVGW